MFQEERLDKIAEHLQARRRATIEELCELLDISKDTARRDLIKLEEQGRLVRTRGGAMLPSAGREIEHYEKRIHMDRSVKQEIGQAAARMVLPGDYVLLDASTTVQFAADVIAYKDNLVVTNSIDIASLLATREGVSLHLLGGAMNREQRFLYGPRALAALADYRFDKLLLGACGISAEGLSSPYEEEGLLIREMIKSAGQVVLLADASKFGKRLFYKVAGLEAVDVLVTDKMPPEDIMEQLELNQVEVMITACSKDEMEEAAK